MTKEAKDSKTATTFFGICSDISELATNEGNFADNIFDRWREDARFFKEANNNGRYIVIMLLKQNDNYQLINDYRI